MQPQVKASGPLGAKIMIVGDFPGADDVMKIEPFQGTAGHELGKMLHEAGILRSECRLTNLLKYRPDGGSLDDVFDFKNKRPIGNTIPDACAELLKEIEQCKPNIVILLGGMPLYCAIQDSAISTWRGSLLSIGGIKCIPTYHPSQIIRNWEWRQIAVHDLKRAEKLSHNLDVPVQPHNFIIRPSVGIVLKTLNQLHDKADTCEEESLLLSVDIETRAGHTACTGIAWSRNDAICIPHMCVENLDGFYSLEDEHAIVLAMRALLTHPKVEVVGQNFLYDAQYFAKHWGFVPNLRQDTMFMQNILFPGLPKGLDFLASMYCEHYTYWKGEGKHWDPRTTSEDQLWGYNCKDACYTYEIAEVALPAIRKFNLHTQYEFQMKLWWAVLRMMLRGVRIDLNHRKALSGELLYEISKREAWLTEVCGHPLNPRSPKQMQAFFYGDLKLPVQRQRKGTRGITTDDEALTKLALLEPVVAPVCNTVRELRSLGVFHSTFVLAGLGEDLRMRCSFNPAGTETYRFNSSKDAFDSGTNLQNVPKGDEEEEHAATKLVLPNIRRLFQPDQGKVIVDVDLAGADAQVVAWEANDAMLKELFRAGKKVHAFNAKDMFGGDAGEDGKREPYYSRAKAGCHLTNYGGKARTLAIATGMTIHESERFQRRWFQIHPGIADWHERVQHALETSRMVRNKFGYRRFYFERIENILPEALAWIPQSTVACVTNRQLLQIDQTLPEIGLLLQVHDSLVLQCERDRWQHVKPHLRQALRVVVPYEDPLIIQSGLKVSPKSWGDCVDEKWEA